MQLTIHQGDRDYLVEAPDNCKVEELGRSGLSLLIPGDLPDDTLTILPLGRVLEAARAGWFGLAVRA
jgi:hypothetical protein